MKSICLATASVLLLGGCLVVDAQTQPPAETRSPCALIAVIDTSQFGDEKSGIQRYVSAIKRVMREFHGYGEVLIVQNRIQSLTDEIAKLEAATPVDSKAIEARKSEVEALRREAKEKTAASRAAYETAMKKALEPIERDIGEALEQFAMKRGFTIVLDVTKLLPALLWLNPSADVTKAFIAEYNSKNP